MKEMFPEIIIIGIVILYMLFSAYQKGKLKGLIKTVFSVGFAILLAIFVRSVVFSPFNIPSESMVSTLHIGDHLFVNKSAYGYSRYSFPYGIKLFDGIINDKPIKQGDIVVFKDPSNLYTDFIKRTVGLPGDKIKMTAGQLYINGQKVKKELIGEHVFVRIAREHEGIVLVTDDNRTVVVKKNEVFLDGKKYDDASITYVNPKVCSYYACKASVLKKYKETLPNGVEHIILEENDYSLYDNTPEYTIGEDEYFMMGDNRDQSGDSRKFGPVKKETVIGRASFIFFSHNNRRALGWLWTPITQLKVDRFGKKPK